MLRYHPTLCEVLTELIRKYRLLPERHKGEIEALVDVLLEAQERAYGDTEPLVLLRILGDEYVPAARDEHHAITAYELLAQAQVIDTLDATYNPRREPYVTYWKRITMLGLAHVIAPFVLHMI